MKLTSFCEHFFLLFFFSLNVFGSKEANNVDIAFIDVDLILKQTPDYLKEVEELETEEKIWQAKIDKEKVKINLLKEKLQAERLILPPETILEKEKEIVFLEKSLSKYERKKFGINGETITKRQLLIKPYLEEIHKILIKIAKEKKIKIIFEKSSYGGSNILYGSPKCNVTKLVLDKLHRNEKTKTIKKTLK